MCDLVFSLICITFFFLFGTNRDIHNKLGPNIAEGMRVRRSAALGSSTFFWYLMLADLQDHFSLNFYPASDPRLHSTINILLSDVNICQ